MAEQGPRIYSEERVRRLRIALGVAAGLCLLFAALAFAGAGQREDGRTAALILGAIGLVASAGCVLTWRLLALPDARARRPVVAAGVILVLLALVTGPVVIFSVPFALLGLSTVFLGLTADEVG